MKKIYTKPEIYFESFSLSTSIAANCDKIISLPSQFACGIPDDNGLGMNVFSPGPSSDCVLPGDSNKEYDGFCYHVPTEVNQLFNS